MKLSKILKESFLEEEDSQASKDAKAKGLVHKGFGRYADKSGKIVAMSRGGKLVPVKGAQKSAPAKARVPPKEPGAQTKVYSPSKKHALIFAKQEGKDAHPMDLADYAYHNYSKITNLPEDERNEERDFPDEIIDFVDEYFKSTKSDKDFDDIRSDFEQYWGS